uniref:Transcription initiation factor IIB n=1 Tax=Lotharella vacuolata TaxID=74820 RepID=A0A0H5BQV0_9EUKA|nr:transcription initiation factor IIB [Lotharella vacuolata]
MEDLESYICSHSDKSKIFSNLVTGDIICKNCGEILYSSPYNDGIILQNINKSNLTKFASDRLGKDLSIYERQDLHTSIKKNSNSFKTKIHVLNSNFIGLNCFKKIEQICNLLNFPNKILLLAKNLSTTFDYKIKTKKLLAKAASYVFVACEYLSIPNDLNKYSNAIPFLSEHDLYKCVKQLKKHIPGRKLYKKQETHGQKKEKCLFVTEKFLQKITKKITLEKNVIRIITIIKMFILSLKKKISMFKNYGKFSSAKILSSTIIIFIYINNFNNKKKLKIKKKNIKRIYCFLKEFLILIKNCKSSIFEKKFINIKRELLVLNSTASTAAFFSSSISRRWSYVFCLNILFTDSSYFKSQS